MRLPVLSSDEMTSEQVDLYRDILGGPRGQGPRAVLLASGAGGLAGSGLGGSRRSLGRRLGSGGFSRSPVRTVTESYGKTIGPSAAISRNTTRITRLSMSLTPS